MQNKTAKTAGEYLESLPADRRAAIEKVRKVVRKNLPSGYEEFVSAGMLAYGIPLSRYPKTYNGQPLMYIGLAAQKNYSALYLMSAYGDKAHEARLRDGFKAAGKKLDMGKSCIRFKSPDDLELDVIAELIGSVSADQWIAIYEKSRKRPK